ALPPPSPRARSGRPSRDGLLARRRGISRRTEYPGRSASLETPSPCRLSQAWCPSGSDQRRRPPPRSSACQNRPTAPIEPGPIVGTIWADFVDGELGDTKKSTADAAMPTPPTMKPTVEMVVIVCQLSRSDFADADLQTPFLHSSLRVPCLP